MNTVPPLSRQRRDDSGSTPEEACLPGRIIADKYRLEELIAEGGMGQVYRARHIDLNVLRAIKVIKAELLLRPGARKRFEREIHTTHQISQRNEHIVLIYDDYGISDGLCYYVMEYLEGERLSQRIAQAGGRLSIAQTLHIALQICEGMEVVHQHGVVHRDLKPENIFLIQKAGQRDFVKLLDFGIAKASHRHTPTTGSDHFVGTLEYMSPEQIAGAPTSSEQSEPTLPSLDGRSDIYALGCCLFEMLTGVPPFPLDDPPSPLAYTKVIQAHLQQTPPSLPQRRPDVSTELDDIIMQMLHKEPEYRFQSMAEIAAALRNLSLSLQAQPAPPSQTKPTQPPPKKHKKQSLTQALTVSLCTLLGMLAFVGWSYINPSSVPPTDTKQTPAPNPRTPEADAHFQKQPLPPRRTPLLRPPHNKPPGRPDKPIHRQRLQPSLRPLVLPNLRTIPRQKASPTPQPRRSRRPRIRRSKRSPRRRQTPIRPIPRPSPRLEHPPGYRLIRIMPPGYLTTYLLRTHPTIQIHHDTLYIPPGVRAFTIEIIHRIKRHGYAPCTLHVRSIMQRLTFKALIPLDSSLVSEDYCKVK